MANILLSDQHPRSGRWATLEDDGRTGWLYLSQSESRDIEADCWVYNARPAIPFTDLDRSNRAQPRPAPAEVLRAGYAAIADGASRQWSVQWAKDGHAALLLENDVPVAIALTAKPHGLNRSLARSGPWGQRWNSELVTALLSD